MKKTVIFSGTTEGRSLSEFLSKAGYDHLVCVATDYGNEMMKESDHAGVHVGRMDKEQIREFLLLNGFESGDAVVDATHPYAVEATENIKAAALLLKAEYIRVSRKNEKYEYMKAVGFDDMDSLASYLENTKGNILLTTGSKELPAFCGAVSEETLQRSYVRILPSTESLEICLRCNVKQKNIIAMHGPFSRMMNEALLRQYDIKYLVTKESGKEGGFEEKLQAATALGINVCVIKRQSDEDGIDIYEAYNRITGRPYESKALADAGKESGKRSGDDTGKHGKRIVYLIGAGPGEVSLMTEAARSAVENSDAVFAASRIASSCGFTVQYEMYKSADIISVLEENKDIRKAAVLFSGDTGFYSGASLLLSELEKYKDDYEPVMMPGISSVVYLASALKTDHTGAVYYSLHGRCTPQRLHELMEYVKYNDKTFVLLSGDEDVRAIGAKLLEYDLNPVIYAGCDLSGENERIIKLTPDEASAFMNDGIITCLIENSTSEKRRLINTIPDDMFIRDKVPMTKECVRNESINRLGIRKGDIVYDIGSGTGSIAIQAAGLDPSVKVYAVEKKESAYSLIKKNIEHFHAGNVIPILSEAPKGLDGLEAPDCVFIGGSSGRLAGIIEYISSRKKNIRYVINAISLETVTAAFELMKSLDAEEKDVIRLSCERMETAGDYHLMRSEDGVYIFSFVY